MQADLLDTLDFCLLRALDPCAVEENDREQEGEDQAADILRAYLSDEP